jgi:hypothetical protein
MQDVRLIGTSLSKDKCVSGLVIQGNRVGVPFLQGLVAKIKAQGDAPAALTRIATSPH